MPAAERESGWQGAMRVRKQKRRGVGGGEQGGDEQREAEEGKLGGCRQREREQRTGKALKLT